MVLTRKLIIYNQPNTNTNPNKLMPIPLGGIPISSYLSISRNIPQVIVRDKIKFVRI